MSEPRFKVGDRVQVEEEGVGTVTAVCEQPHDRWGYYVRFADGEHPFFQEYWLEPEEAGKLRGKS